MAYVRRRGNQLAIVHGTRNPDTGKVEQRILFTLYSRDEAREALGETSEGSFRLQGLLEHEYPDLRFDWPRIRKGIREHLDVLPERYPYRAERLAKGFRRDLCTFTRQLLLADPQDLTSAAELLRDHRYELEYLDELIRWRLEHVEQAPSQWTADNPFYWRFSLQGSQVPPEAEEHAAGFYDRGEYDRAEAVFRLLTECFEGYAEGMNYLGLIALDQGRLDDAIARFRDTVEQGRRLFPRRIAKERYGRELATRPYLRGLGNLALALNEVGRYPEALAVCDRLEAECGDEVTAAAHRASVYLNTGRRQEASEAALSLIGIDPSEGFVAALARFELGQKGDALALFLHGALNHPLAARLLLGQRTPKPRDREEAQDHNAGVRLLRALHGYLDRHGRACRTFFRRVLRDEHVAALLDEVADAVRKDRAERHLGNREAFDRLREMRSLEFARAEAATLLHLAGAGPLHRAPPGKAPERGSP
ncbi:MAG: hypothetical protein P1P84_23770 [Deferrisomatales bacterium]|nr:hypothetical protein [Deferrisomatales bacterium]